MKKIIAWFIFILSILGTAIFGVSYHFAMELIHNPPEKRALFHEKFPNLHPTVVFEDYGLKEHEEITLTTQDGFKIVALYIPSKNGAAVIAQHGYKMTHTAMVPIIAPLIQHGYGAILPTLRSHGDSEGELISFGLHELQDIDAAYQYLLTRNEVSPERIGMIGNSMGGALSILYAAKNPAIKAVVAHGPYDSLYNTIGVSVKKFTGLPAFPFAPIILFIVEQQLNFDTETVAPINYIDQLYPRSVLILGAGRDTFVEPDGAKRLCEKAGQACELWFDPELDHIEFHKKHPEDFAKRVTTFFDKHLLFKEIKNP